MRIHINSITPYKPLSLDEELDFSSFSFASAYPVLGIEDARILGEVAADEEGYLAKVKVSANVKLSDARDNLPFFERMEIEEEVPLLSEDDPSGEGYILEGPILDTHHLAFSLLFAQVPIKPLRKGSPLPTSGDGYSVYQEEEYSKTDSQGSPFDKLLDLDL